MRHPPAITLADLSNNNTHLATMLTATQSLAAAHTPSHGTCSLTSTVSSGRWVSPVTRRRQSSSTRRTTSKISCQSISRLGQSNGKASVLTIDPPELASRRKQKETTVKMKAVVTVHLKGQRGRGASSWFSRNLDKFFSRNWLSVELVSSEMDPGEKLHLTAALLWPRK
ncbi:hypothetical protein EJB05_41570, partial [Eragrostis curvula]